jgi:O-antigen ligase
LKNTLARIEFSFSMVVLVSCLIFGGSSQPDLLAHGVVQATSIPLLALVLARSSLQAVGFREAMVSPYLLALMVCLIPILQVLPITGLGAVLLEDRMDGGFSVDRHSMSMNSRASIIVGLSLLPSVSLFLSVINLSYRDRRSILLAVIVVGVTSAVLGLAQVYGGASSFLRFYSITNGEEAVGFFSNRNHYAVLLYITIVLISAFMIDALKSVNFGCKRRSKQTLIGGQAFVIALGICGLVVVAVAEAMARSRAGMTLTAIGGIGIAVLAWSDRHRHSSIRISSSLMGGVALFLAISSPRLIGRVMEALSRDPWVDYRIIFTRNTLSAAKAFWPLGSGLGTFVEVYPHFERVDEILANTYVNHAHNDLAEIWLEAGVVGAVVAGLGLVAIFVQAVLAWRQPGSSSVADGPSARDILLARAATIVIALVIIHSAAEYHLRTPAIASVFACLLAVLFSPPSASVEIVELEMSENVVSQMRRSTHSPQAYEALNFPDMAPKNIDAVIGSGYTQPSDAVRSNVVMDWPEAWRLSEDEN